MNLNEFNALPLAVQVKYLAAQILGGANVTDIEVPKKPFSPKYDEKIPRKGGQFAWASETDIEGLRYWHGKFQESAAGGGQYAEKDQKRADAMRRFIAWREWFPTERWQGERFGDVVTAEAPSGKPALHDHQARGQRQGENKFRSDYAEPPAEPSGGFGSAGGDDDIPFIACDLSATERWW